MKTKNQILKDQPLTISEIIDINRNLSALLAKQKTQIKDMWDEILYWRNNPIEEENKKLKAENKRLMNRFSDEQTDRINVLHKEMGLAPLGATNPSEEYLSVSTSKE